MRGENPQEKPKCPLSLDHKGDRQIVTSGIFYGSHRPTLTGVRGHTRPWVPRGRAPGALLEPYELRDESKALKHQAFRCILSEDFYFPSHNAHIVKFIPSISYLSGCYCEWDLSHLVFSK